MTDGTTNEAATRGVSAVVTTRNSARTLEACLRSVREQPGVDVELIVVDNASTDGTQAIASRYADAVLQVGPERSAQRNAGARRATRAYVAFFDSDMALEPNVLLRCVEAAERGSRAVAIPEHSFGEGFWAACKALERSFYVDDEVVSAARFFRREDVLACGGYDEELTGPEDWDLSMRIAGDQPLVFVDALIQHDEGRQSLAVLYDKKRYYGRSMPRFVRKHGREALHKINPWRSSLVTNLPAILRDPRLGAGLVLMKAIEMAGGIVGAFAGTGRIREAIYADRSMDETRA
jgi:glycosyltransferase involved in cell wall biosynthesis